MLLYVYCPSKWHYQLRQQELIYCCCALFFAPTVFPSVLSYIHNHEALVPPNNWRYFQPCPLLVKISVVLPFPLWPFSFYCTPSQLHIFAINCSLSFHFLTRATFTDHSLCSCARQKSVSQVKSSQGLFKVPLIYTCHLAQGWLSKPISSNLRDGWATCLSNQWQQFKTGCQHL